MGLLAVLFVLMQGPTSDNAERAHRIFAEMEREREAAVDARVTERVRAAGEAQQCFAYLVDANRALYEFGSKGPDVVDLKLRKKAIKATERWLKECGKK